MKLSAVIITLNEEKNLERCLSSLVGVADEVIVIDSFSIDRTEEIAKMFQAKFIGHKFEGHIQQKNFALQQAQYEWILSLDADEALDSTLRDSIIHAKSSGEMKGYTMNRLTNYCGKWIRHCGWYPDTKLRMVRNGSAEWRGTNPHDRLEMKQREKTGHLSGDILHYSYYTREDHYKQIEYFGRIAAHEMFHKGIRVSSLVVALKVFAQFMKSYLFKLGFLDGSAGWLISVRSAYATRRKYQLLSRMWLEPVH